MPVKNDTPDLKVYVDTFIVFKETDLVPVLVKQIMMLKKK